ncbi:MAG: heparinase II/III family protein [Oscillospiraceae bacterium]|jgi:hypothetical protein|nr:heparinase II/III family protein [Oscillospiraceae bacterium]
MKENIYHGEVDITYIFKEATVPSDVLVVAFPGANGNEATEWGYTFTVAKFNVNGLFFKHSDVEKALNYGDSRYTYLNKKPILEDSIMGLINSVCEKKSIKRIIITGSSMGGFCSLYYGLKYGWDIVAGAPPWSYKDIGLLALTGGTNQECKNWAENMLATVVKEAGERGRAEKSIYVSWGKGEGNWLNPLHAPLLLKQLDDANIKYTVKLSDYQDHMSISRMFPKILETRLDILLGLVEESEEEIKTDEMILTDLVKENFSEIALLAENLQETSLNLEIKNSIQYADNTKSTVLRNFVYANHGYFWHPGWKEPQETGKSTFYWSKLPTNCVGNALAFLFQQTILNYYSYSKDKTALEWCSDNLQKFLENVRGMAAATRDFPNWWHTTRRFHFIINYLCAMDLCKDKLGLYNDIDTMKNEIIKCFKLVSNTLILLTDCESQYRRINMLLHAAALFKNNEEFYKKSSDTALMLANELTDYYFDKNGVLIFQQARMQYILRWRLKELVEFIEANFEPNKFSKFLRKKFDKIENITAMLIASNQFRPALGHSEYWRIPDMERKLGIFAEKDSNLCIFSTENTYITVQSGTNIHAALKHCDLLSFTFQYDKQQIIYDSEGGNGELADFAQSAVAHSALICDNADYVSPTYIDWTTIDKIDNQEDYVAIYMSHNLFDNIELKRTLIWLKPNVIILIDNGISNGEHLFTQNFILPDIAVKGKEILSGKVGAVNFEIKQFNGDFEFKDYHGTVNEKAPQEQLRGSLCTGFNKVRKGLNLAYNKTADNAIFFTSIEAHSPNEELKKDELSIKSLVLNETNLEITFNNDIKKIIEVIEC